MPKNSVKRSYLGGFLRVLSLSVLIILLAVVPLAKENSIVIAQPEKPEIKAEVKSYEAEKIFEIKSVNPKVSKHKKNTAPKRQQAKTEVKEIKKDAPKEIKEVKKEIKKEIKTVKTVPYDKVFSLIQTGERALRKDSSVIKIYK